MKNNRLSQFATFKKPPRDQLDKLDEILKRRNSQMRFENILKMINQMYSKNGRLPKEIHINPRWYEQQLQQSFVLRNPGDNLLEQLTGIPVHKNDSVETFEFIYEE